MPHTEAIVVKLMSPTRSKAQWLEHTAEAFQRAVQLGLDAAQSQHTSRRALLHKVAYRTIREQFGLPSEFARMAVNAAVALARSFDRLRRSGRHGAFPHVQRSQGIGLGIHAYKVIQDGDRFVLRVSTGEQRQFMWFPLCVPARYQEKMPMVRGDARLFRRKGDWYALLPLRIPPLPAVRDGEPAFIGIDLGVVRHAVLATPDGLVFFDGRAARHVREHFASLRRRYQQHRRTDQVKAQQGKEHRWMQDINHQLSRRIVGIAAAYPRAVIVLERLDGIRSRTGGSKRFNRMLASWAFRDLVSKVQYKAAREGIPVLMVDPRRTSQTCSRCGHTSPANRPEQATFRCVRCGCRLNADANAARNLAAQGPGALAQGQPDTARPQGQTESTSSWPDGAKECAAAHSDSNLASPLCGTPRL